MMHHEIMIEIRDIVGRVALGCTSVDYACLELNGLLFNAHQTGYNEAMQEALARIDTTVKKLE
jgi:predicted enzyme involved in methoxymalonyl-ACP biosynthesis